MVQRFHHHGIGLCTALTISRHNHWEHYHLNHYCCYHLTITATTSIITNSAHSTTTTFPTTTAATTTTSSTAISAATATATTADFFREYRTGQLPFAVRAHRYCAPLCSRDSRGQLVRGFDAGFGYTTGHITMMRSTVVRKLLLDHSPAGIIKREMHACIITLVIYQTGLVVT